MAARYSASSSRPAQVEVVGRLVDEREGVGDEKQRGDQRARLLTAGEGRERALEDGGIETEQRQLALDARVDVPAAGGVERASSSAQRARASALGAAALGASAPAHRRPARHRRRARSSRGATRRRARSRRAPPRASAATDRAGSRGKRRASTGAASTPPVGCSSPAIRRSSVVLPRPLRPTSAVRQPVSITQIEARENVLERILIVELDAVEDDRCH